MKNDAHSIADFGNWVAHSIESKERITEKDAKMALEFLNIFLNYFVVYHKHGLKMSNRMNEVGK